MDLELHAGPSRGQRHWGCGGCLGFWVILSFSCEGKEPAGTVGPTLLACFGNPATLPTQPCITAESCPKEWLLLSPLSETIPPLPSFPLVTANLTISDRHKFCKAQHHKSFTHLSLAWASVILPSVCSTVKVYTMWFVEGTVFTCMYPTVLISFPRSGSVFSTLPL